MTAVDKSVRSLRKISVRGKALVEVIKYTQNLQNEAGIFPIESPVAGHRLMLRRLQLGFSADGVSGQRLAGAGRPHFQLLATVR